jgi:hypothetical protein
MIEYNKENLLIVSNLIINNLTPDLLPKKWVERNASNPMFGHCHTASGCLYKIFGPKAINMYRGIDDVGMSHVWIKDKQGNIIDLTSEQYTSIGRIPPYDKEEKSGIYGFDYRKRVLELLKRVTYQLENHYE